MADVADLNRVKDPDRLSNLVALFELVDGFEQRGVGGGYACGSGGVGEVVQQGRCVGLEPLCNSASQDPAEDAVGVEQGDFLKFVGDGGHHALGRRGRRLVRGVDGDVGQPRAFGVGRPCGALIGQHREVVSVGLLGSGVAEERAHHVVGTGLFEYLC